jgi:hypothetical protein
MAARYQHITAPIQRDIASRVGGRIWQVSDRQADGRRDEKQKRRALPRRKARHFACSGWR